MTYDRPDEQRRLMPTFEVPSSEMDIEDVDDFSFTHLDVNAQAATLFMSVDADVVVVHGPAREPAENHIFVRASVQTPVFTENEMQSEFFRQEASLLALFVPGRDTQNFLQGYDVSIQFPHNFRDPLRPHTAVEPPALMDVVCRYPNPSRALVQI